MTPYDMRISDWSSDVFSSDLVDHIVRNAQAPALVVRCRATGPYERVVVATDLSDCSRAALLSAARLFPGSDLTVVHAFHVPYEAWLKSDDVKDYVRTEAQKGLEADRKSTRLNSSH